LIAFEYEGLAEEIWVNNIRKYSKVSEKDPPRQFLITCLLQQSRSPAPKSKVTSISNHSNFCYRKEVNILKNKSNSHHKHTFSTSTLSSRNKISPYFTEAARKHFSNRSVDRSQKADQGKSQRHWFLDRSKSPQKQQYR